MCAAVVIDSSLRPGLAFMTLHFPDEVETNILTIDAIDPKSGTAEFKAILVYDVSRWGRFQEVDEAAKLEQKGLRPSPPASRQALLRRLRTTVDWLGSVRSLMTFLGVAAFVAGAVLHHVTMAYDIDADKIAARTKEYEDRFLSPFIAAERGVAIRTSPRSESALDGDEDLLIPADRGAAFGEMKNHIRTAERRLGAIAFPIGDVLMR